jgi:SAM-dependent methyltransferase
MINSLRNNLSYYLLASYRRKFIDKLQNRYISLYQGVVLDIGGRDRGKFKSPKDKVAKWITTDIEAKRNPDMVIDVAHMPQIESNSIDVINAIELFEHVEKIDSGLKECHRVLRAGGNFIISVPFLYPFHGDPYDFQRWTLEKWQKELEKLGFQIRKKIIMGHFFTVGGDMMKTLILSLPWIFKLPALVLSPLIDLFVGLDILAGRNRILKKYHGGYFIIAIKNK